MLGHGPLGSAPLGTVRTIHASDTLILDVHASSVVSEVRDAAGEAHGRAICVGYAPEVQTTTAPRPPREAKLLLRYALPRKHQEDIVGDLEEAYYTEWLPEHGSREAQRLYWWHAIRSIAPMLWSGVKTSGIIAAILGAADWLRDRLG
jgi:hypothetical protein